MMRTRDLVSFILCAWIWIVGFVAADALRGPRICDGTEHPAQLCVSEIAQ